ncbi:HAMP domain-containing sensor histidine kinase [Hyalangium sp.]|uniref:sensor histidine kinase n=1 Tax=Hyalangium sp. TaxID=2028555 RepID=UPI002D292C83|nr:HAMP domain-containing sensor histidine kinase [Hyalangium sp.]HYH96252.1 HAMP domain-containing sensor histidine kinase [Hyalangium sp.]
MTPQDTKALDALLEESVDQQRRRVLKVGAAVRVAGALLFLLIVGALWLTGRQDWALYPLPLALYLGVAAALLALHGKRFVQWLDVAQSLVDVGLVFWVQHAALPLSRFPSGIAGFSLGLFSLVVVLSSLTLMPSVVYTTALLSAVAQAVLMREADVSYGSVVLAAVVLFLVAFMSQYGSQRLRQLVLAFTRTEVERQIEARRFQELEQAQQTIEQMLGETRAQNEQLLALQRDKDQLIQFLVHDLRSPLSALTMTFSWLEAELSVGGDLALMQGVRSGIAVTGRMERMITELLDLPRLEEGKLELRPQRLDITAMFEEVRQAFGQAAQFRRLTLEVEAPVGQVFQGDKALLMRVVENLVANALRHTPPGGRVRLEAGKDGSAPYLAVRNDGTPIEEGLRTRLFDKHMQGEQERSARSGYGLGLYFSRLAVEAHGGRIAVEDVQGWTTSFVARLPAPSESSRAA